MARKAKGNPDEGLVAPGETGKLEVEKRTDEKIGRTLARITLDPQTRNANLAMSFGSQMFGDQLKPDIAESSAVLAEEIQRAMKGDLSLASRIFTSQAISLDALFTDMARRSGNNIGHYPDAADRYMGWRSRPKLPAAPRWRLWRSCTSRESRPSSTCM